MATLYVRPVNGSDANDGLSYANGFLTTQKAADTAVAGDTVRLCKEATETTAAQIDFDTNIGSEEGKQQIVFESYSSDGSVREDGYTVQASASIAGGIFNFAASEHIEIRGVDLDGNSNAAHCVGSTQTVLENVVFENCRMFGATSHGVQANWNSASPDYQSALFINCEVFDNGGGGIIVTNPVDGGMTVIGCVVHDNGSHGILLEGTGGAGIVKGCEVYDNAGIGIATNNGVQAAQISGNTIFGNDSHGIQLGGSLTELNNIHHNSLVSNGGYGIFFDGFNDQQYIDYNHFHANTSGQTDLASTPGENNTSGDPLFASTTDGSEDFTPASNSPLAGAGVLGTDIGARKAASGGGGSPVTRGYAI